MIDPLLANWLAFILTLAVSFMMVCIGVAAVLWAQSKFYYTPFDEGEDDP